MGRKLKNSIKRGKEESFSKYVKSIFSLLISVLFIGMLSCACTQQAAEEPEVQVPEDTSQAVDVQPEEEIPVSNTSSTSDVEVSDQQDDGIPTKMVSYDVTTIGRSDPFMPYDEYLVFSQAKSDAVAQANAHNAEIARIKSLQFTAVREADDISPYSFNLPVPPTSLAGEDAAAAKITRTKVVGIMYNDQSPSAIINVDEKDYLVRPGDKIIGQEYMVDKINPTWITVTLGHNVYSAAIGEQFSKDEIVKYQNDIYDLKNRFGGRKS